MACILYTYSLDASVTLLHESLPYIYDIVRVQGCIKSPPAHRYIDIFQLVRPFDHRMMPWKFRDDISNGSGVYRVDRQTDWHCDTNRQYWQQYHRHYADVDIHIFTLVFKRPPSCMFCTPWSYMFPRYLQYPLIDFRQSFVTGASRNKHELIRFWGQRSRSHYRGGGVEHSTLPSSEAF